MMRDVAGPNLAAFVYHPVAHCGPEKDLFSRYLRVLFLLTGLLSRVFSLFRSLVFLRVVCY
jgi:hypothetical protein